MNQLIRVSILPQELYDEYCFIREISLVPTFSPGARLFSIYSHQLRKSDLLPVAWQVGTESAHAHSSLSLLRLPSDAIAGT